MSTTSIMSVKEMIERSFGNEEVSTTFNILKLISLLALLQTADQFSITIKITV